MAQTPDPTPPGVPESDLEQNAPPPELAIPLPLIGIGSEKYWRDQIQDAKKRAKKEYPLWRTNLNRYKGQAAKLPGLVPRNTITVNVDFYNTEQKKAQLFYQTPEVQLAARQPQYTETAALFQQVVNYRLGPCGVNAESFIDEILFDEIVTAGFGCSVIGYEAEQVQVPMPAQIDPMTQQPIGAPTMVPKTVWSRYFWERITPTYALIPARWTSTNYDKSPWLGYGFPLDADNANRHGISRSDLTESYGDQTLISDNDREFIEDTGTGYVIWYRASMIDKSVRNPEVFRRLVLAGTGRNDVRAVVHEPSPYQVIGPNGEVQKGMRGNPIHFFTLRTVGDTAYPPSDCTISRTQVDELSISRSQMLLQRKLNLPMRLADGTLVDKAELDRLERGDIQGVLVVKKGNLDKAFKAMDQANLPPENFAINDIIQNDIRSQWALGANSQSVQQQGGKTATEAAIIAKATDTRLTKERNRHLDQYCEGVGKLASLFQLFDDEVQYAPLVGKDGANVIQAWTKADIQGDYVFSIKADSSVRVDAAEELQEDLQTYNLLGRDPHFNRVPMLKSIAGKRGLDPAQAIIDPLPPTPAPPDPPKISLALKADDLTNPMVQQILKQNGIELTMPLPIDHVAQAVGLPGNTQPVVKPTMPQPNGTPGAAERMPPVSQHEASRANQRSGPKVGIQ